MGLLPHQQRRFGHLQVTVAEARRVTRLELAQQRAEAALGDEGEGLELRLEMRRLVSRLVN